MKHLKLYLLILISAMISCSENKNATSTKKDLSEQQQKASSENAPTPVSNIPMVDSIITDGQNVETLMPLIISFYSIGEGIDRGQTEKLLAYIQNYEKKAGKKVEYSQVHWGREGETDFCFPMIGYSETQVTEFLNGAKEALNTAQHVHFIQNQACRKGR